MRAGTRFLSCDPLAGPITTVTDRLQAWGFTSQGGLGLDQLQQELARGQTDVALIDAVRMGAIEVAGELKRDTACRHVPVVAVAAAEPGQIAAHALAVGADDVLPLPVGDAALRARVNAWVGQVAMAIEVRRREVVMRRFDELLLEDADRRLERPTAGILLVGRACGEQVQIMTALGGRIAATYVEAPESALEQLRRQAFDAVLLTAIRDPEVPRWLAAQVRADPRLSDLPVLAVIPDGGPIGAEEPFAWGVSDALVQPIHPEVLRLRVQGWVQQQRLRRALRGTVDGRTLLPTNDYLTGLFSHGFLHAYLGLLLPGNAHIGKPLAVAAIDIRGFRHINEQHGFAIGDAVLAELGLVLARCVRADDLPARIGADRLAIVFNGLGAEEAEQVILRVVRTLSGRRFPSAAPQPFTLDLAFGIAAALERDSPASLVARAVERLGAGELRQAS